LKAKRKIENVTWQECPEKFLGLGHHVYGFFGEFHPMKILRISPDYFSGNS